MTDDMSMTATDLEALARRVETEPASDDLRDEIARAFGWEPGKLKYYKPERTIRYVPPDFSRSIDAAASLLPSDWRCEVLWHGNKYCRTVAYQPDNFASAVACRSEVTGDYAEARARCAASLRVRAMEKGEAKQYV